MTGHRYVYGLQGHVLAVLRLSATFLVLNVGLVLPAVLASGRFTIGPSDLVSFDLVALLAVVVLARGTRMQRGARRLATGLYVLLLVYEIYDAAMQVALKRPGLFYDDIQHIAGAVHLIGNAATLPHLAIGTAGAAAIGTFCWFAARAFRWVTDDLASRSARRISVLGIWVCVPLVLYGYTFDLGNHTPLYNESVMMTSEKIAGNVRASVQLRERVQEFNRRRADSTYAQYETVQLSKRPHLFLLFIESYGEVLRHHEETEAPYRALMQEVGDRLSRAGWLSASTTSLAPVNGGTSWLSVGSVLMGMPIKHQSMFNVIEPNLRHYPHLIYTLQTFGYRTAVLQPPTRPRIGVGVSNPYGFDKTFYFRDMQYTGRRYGWGIVPDQYSLGLAHEQFVAPAEEPVMLMFEMVASHAPWDPPPPLVDDWRTLNKPNSDARATTRSQQAVREAQSPAVTARAAPTSPLPNVADGGSTPVHRLFRSVRYDWQVISEYMIDEMPDSSLVVVLGDHQPPIVSTESDVVPVHVFSRDPAHIDAAVSHGFKRGLVELAPPGRLAPSAFRHAGLYSLMMNLLAQPVGREASQLFPVLPKGVDRPAHRLSLP